MGVNWPSSINDKAINRQQESTVWCSRPSLNQWKQVNFIWQGPWIRCNTCRDMQNRRSSLAANLPELFDIKWRKAAIPNTFNDATIIHPLKRKSSSLWQSLGASVYCQMLGWSLIQEGQQNNWHDLHSNTASGEMPGTECGHLHDLCWPYQRIWHSLSWNYQLENFGKVWLSCQVHSNGATVLQLYTFKCPKLLRMFLCIPCDNGIPIKYRFDGKLFNLKRLQAKFKVQTKVLDVILFANDMAKGALTGEKVWIKYVIHLTAMISQSASKRLRWNSSQLFESLTRSLRSQ